MDTKKSPCATCKNQTLPSGCEPCCYCVDYKRWEPKDSQPEASAPMVGIDPGAPLGDKTSVRIDWGETGREMIGPAVGIDDDERGPVLAVTRMPLLDVIGCAIDGIKDHASHIGLLLTDKTMSEKDLFDSICTLEILHEDWVKLETERAAIRKAVEHVKDRDA